MITFENCDIVVIPMALNITYSLNRQTTQLYRVDKDTLLPIDFIVKTVDYIQNNCSKASVIAVDMKDIRTWSSRGFSKFEDIEGYKNIVFFNVQGNSDVKERLKEDLRRLKPMLTDNYLYFQNTVFGVSPESFQHEIEKIEKCRIAEIVKRCVENKTQFLNSSSVWSNKYVHMKDLFLKTDDAQIILFKMAEVINDHFRDVHALVSTSKTGAAFASILGQLVNKKVVHCIALGPVFAIAQDDIKKSIRKNKRYLYVGDFVCLGTEIKILNALVRSEGAMLEGGIAVASYLDTGQPEMNESIMGKVKYLIDVTQHEVDYKIGISEQSLGEETI